MTRASTGAIVAAILLFSAMPASAAHTNQTDSNDVLGLLDLQQVSLAHETQPYVWTFRTYATWTTRQIWDRGYFVVQLDTIGSATADYLVVVRSIGTSLRGELFRKRLDGTEVHVRSLRAWRAGARGAAVAVPPTALNIGVNRTSVWWWTASVFSSGRCPSTCVDAVPDEGTPIEKPLGG